MKSEKTIFEKGSPGRVGINLTDNNINGFDKNTIFPDNFLRKNIFGLPSLSELDVVRHYTRLSQKNYSVDTNFYPLGSCTMKYNPKINEKIASFSGFNFLNPLQNVSTIQGALQIIWELEKSLSEVTGMDRFSFQPSAGAHGELTAMFIVSKYFNNKNEKRTKVLVPDSSHGTNPASAAMCGYKIVEIKTNSEGGVDLKDLISKMDKDVACLMLTNPNTLGLFEKDILKVSEIIHKLGGLMYYDGANLNALLGRVKPLDMGFDILHLNLHKTFSTPHGGGGPGSGPVGVTKDLKDFLPVPLVDKKDNMFYLDYSLKHSIGKVRAFYGNFSVLLKAYAYIFSLGAKGIKEISDISVLNANYLLTKLKKAYTLKYNRKCMHELVLSAEKFKEKNISALDIAKRLIDFNIHPPTMYFPLIIKEALMVEPTETESLETLNDFIEVMLEIAKEAEDNPEKLRCAPFNFSMKRVDEVKAARELDIRWKPLVKKVS